MTSQDVGPVDGGSVRGCLGCFLGGLVVLGALGVGLTMLYRRSEAVDTRLDAAVVQPWARAVREGTVEAAWASLTTEGYRTRNPRDAVVRTYREAVERWGPPRDVSIIVSQGVFEATSRRSLQHMRTSWSFERGTALVLTFHIVEDEHGELRIDRVAPGGGGSIPPPDLPPGPF